MNTQQIKGLYDHIKLYHANAKYRRVVKLIDRHEHRINRNKNELIMLKVQAI